LASNSVIWHHGSRRLEAPLRRDRDVIKVSIKEAAPRRSREEGRVDSAVVVRTARAAPSRTAVAPSSSRQRACVLNSKLDPIDAHLRPVTRELATGSAS